MNSSFFSKNDNSLEAALIALFQGGGKGNQKRKDRNPGRQDIVQFVKDGKWETTRIPLLEMVDSGGRCMDTFTKNRRRMARTNALV